MPTMKQLLHGLWQNTSTPLGLFVNLWRGAWVVKSLKFIFVVIIYVNTSNKSDKEITDKDKDNKDSSKYDQICSFVENCRPTLHHLTPLKMSLNDTMKSNDIYGHLCPFGYCFLTIHPYQDHI